MAYEFRDASGHICCKAKHKDALCPKCKERAGVNPAAQNPTRAAEHDPIAGYRPALAAFAQEMQQQSPPPQQRASSNDAPSFVPPDSYGIALSREATR